MNKGLNIFLAVLLCVVVYIGLLLSFYSSKNVEASTPYLGDVKSTRGTYGTYAVSANSMGSNMATISVRSANSIFHHRSVFSYVPAASMPTYSQSPIGGTLSKSVASPIYTTSSAEFHSFGGGGNGGGASMSGGVVSGNTTLSPNSFSVSLPNIPSLAYYPQSTASFDGVNPAFASSLSLPEIGTTSVGYGASAPLGLSGRRNASSIGGNLDEWVQGLINQYGWMYSDGTIDYFDRQVLEDLYNKAIENGELPVGVTWEMFLSWFDKQSDRYAFPIPSGVWFMCFLALGYGLYIAYRRKQKVVNS
jgi:hypothetical protein